MSWEFRSWEDYYIPGSNVLRNLLPATEKYGEADADRLERFELTLTGSRVVELAGTPVVGAFDLPHLQEVHRRIFFDVYPWAGQLRGAPVSGGQHSHPNRVLHPVLSLYRTNFGCSGAVTARQQPRRVRGRPLPRPSNRRQ